MIDLEAARAELNRTWVPYEERFSAPASAVVTIDKKLAKPAPEMIVPAYSSTGRKFSEISQIQLATGRPSSRKFKNPHRMPVCEDHRGHWFVSNSVNGSGQPREKCRRCGRSRNVTLSKR